MAGESSSTERSTLLPMRLFWRVAIAAFLWWIITGGDSESWIVGGPAILIAAWMSGKLPQGGRARFSVRGWIALVPLFLWKSLLGGWDVAWRVLSPALPVAPGFFEYRLGLREGPARRFFFHLINLTPGTLSARLDGATLLVHTLSPENALGQQLREMEKRVAAAFGETLAS